MTEYEFCVMQFALVSLIKRMAIDHPYHTIFQVIRARYVKLNVPYCFKLFFLLNFSGSSHQKDI